MLTPPRKNDEKADEIGRLQRLQDASHEESSSAMTVFDNNKSLRKLLQIGLDDDNDNNNVDACHVADPCINNDDELAVEGTRSSPGGNTGTIATKAATTMCSVGSSTMPSFPLSPEQQKQRRRSNHSHPSDVLLRRQRSVIKALAGVVEESSGYNTDEKSDAKTEATCESHDEDNRSVLSSPEPQRRRRKKFIGKIKKRLSLWRKQEQAADSPLDEQEVLPPLQQQDKNSLDYLETSSDSSQQHQCQEKNALVVVENDVSNNGEESELNGFSNSSDEVSLLSDSLDRWVRSAQLLLHSREFRSFTESSRDIAGAAGAAALQTVFWCVGGGPAIWMITTSTCVVGRVITGSASAVLNHVSGVAAIATAKPAIRLHGNEEDVLDRLCIDGIAEEPPIRERSHQSNSFSLPSKELKRDVGPSRYRLNVDDLGVLSSPPLLSHPEEDEGANSQSMRTAVSHVYFASSCHSSSENAEESNALLVRDTLNRLVARGLSLLANDGNDNVSKPAASATMPSPGPVSGTADSPAAETVVNWKPVGATHKLLRSMASLPNAEERREALARDTLIWSGFFQPQQPGSLQQQQYDFNNNNNDNTTIPLFMARGVVVGRGPRQVLQQLWDNSRTSEYNSFCVGRTNLVVIEEQKQQENQVLPVSSLNKNNTGSAPSPTHSSFVGGTKIVRSETRIPFTSLSVNINVLIHARPLDPNDPDKGFVVVSRSVDTGENKDGESFAQEASTPCADGSENEVLWGVNVLKRVTDHADRTDITSVSQVKTQSNIVLVPSFLAKRIAIMGVENFLKNMREGKMDTPTVAVGASASTTGANSNQ